MQNYTSIFNDLYPRNFASRGYEAFPTPAPIHGQVYTQHGWVTPPVPAPSLPKIAGHDTVLRAIQNKGSMITIKFHAGDSMNGVLVARDQYTLTVRTLNGVRNVVFKNAIKYFSGDETTDSKLD